MKKSIFSLKKMDFCMIVEYLFIYGAFLYIQEVLFQFLPWHISCIVIVQMVVDAGDVFHIVEHLGDVVAHDDNGAFLVDLFQHLIHLLLESAVDVGVGFV